MMIMGKTQPHTSGEKYAAEKRSQILKVCHRQVVFQIVPGQVVVDDWVEPGDGTLRMGMPQRAGAPLLLAAFFGIRR